MVISFSPLELGCSSMSPMLMSPMLMQVSLCMQATELASTAAKNVSTRIIGGAAEAKHSLTKMADNVQSWQACSVSLAQLSAGMIIN